jgi:nicotinamidase-related amidase
MPDALTIEPARSALLSMDYQPGILGAYPGDNSAMIERAGAVQRAARAAGMLVIHVVVGFRAGYPEISPRNSAFSTIKQSGRFTPADSGATEPAIKPEAGDVIVVKHRVSAFMGTDLEMILRANDIEMLVMFGVSTSGVVLSTLRHAADADYRCVVVRDCCTDRDLEVHACLFDKVFPRQATVVGSAEVLAALRGGASG